MATIGINGFGRMGRLGLRAGWGMPGLDFVWLNGLAVRVPLLNASLTALVLEVKRPVDRDEVNAHFEVAGAGALAGILGYEDWPPVSVDYTNDPRSAVVDGTQLKGRPGMTTNGATRTA